MNKTNKLEGKVAIITGASKGIGAGIAKRLAAEGASVVVNYSSSREGAEHVVAQIEAEGGRATAVQANLAKKPEIERLFDETLKAFGRIDILVNNAGVYEFLPLKEITEEHFHRQFDLNVLGLILATQQAAQHIGPEGGSIINIGSVAGRAAHASGSIYSATKAAVNVVTKAFASELGPRGIRVHAVNPGMVETEGLHTIGFAESDFRKTVESQTPLRRIGQPEDIAPLVAFLASPAASWITGEAYHVTGGYG
jgi:3-oxoacyl-[acyl-carrier protein] reductase